MPVRLHLACMWFRLLFSNMKLPTWSNTYGFVYQPGDVIPLTAFYCSFVLCKGAHRDDEDGICTLLLGERITEGTTEVKRIG